jgi:hypothetical protein
LYAVCGRGLGLPFASVLITPSLPFKILKLFNGETVEPFSKPYASPHVLTISQTALPWPMVALIFALPAPTTVTLPLLSTVATSASEEDQTTP